MYYGMYGLLFQQEYYRFVEYDQQHSTVPFECRGALCLPVDYHQNVQCRSTVFWTSLPVP